MKWIKERLLKIKEWIKEWTLKKAFIIVVFAAATFAVSFVFGSAITAAVSPGASGPVTIIITTILVIVCARIVGLPGTFTILVGLFTLFAIPTTMFGPPGPQKVVIGLATGLVYDLVWMSAKGKLGDKWSLPLAASVSTAVSIGLIYVLLIMLDHPGKDFLGQYLVWIVLVYALLGFIGGWLGNKIYDRGLSNLTYIKMLRDQDAPGD